MRIDRSDGVATVAILCAMGGMKLSIYLTLFVTLFFGQAAAQSDVKVDDQVDAKKDDLKAFPAAGTGYERFVFRLPPQEDEEALKVTLVIGKTVKTDAANRYFFFGSLERVRIPGWGYSYFQLESTGEMAGTLMATPDSLPQVERFVEVRSQLDWLRYNSKLPVVVIVPEGFDVKYRIWTAGEIEAAVVE